MVNELKNELALGVRDGLPDALRVLSREFPKTSWQGHPNFGQMVEFWLQRHAMFRQLLDVLESDVQAVMDKTDRRQRLWAAVVSIWRDAAEQFA